MPSLTYPPPAPTLTGDVVSIHRLLASPTLISRALQTMLQQRFISDALLTGRFTSAGGAIQFEQDEPLYTERVPEAIRPGMEYPLTSLGIGPTQIVEVVKWGQDAPVTDESIKRLQMSPVMRAFVKLVNQMVKHVDGIALAAIASSITQTTAAAAPWTTATAAQMLRDVALAKANIDNLNQGYMADTVVVDPLAWARAMSTFATSGFLPREASGSNPVVTGEFPVVLGMRWLSTPNVPTVNVATVVDSTQLGGMADEDLGGPGYAGSLAGVETKSIRDEEHDKYLLRARRVTVPVVLNPGAGWEITGI